MEASAQISQERLGSQAVRPEKAAHKAVRRKLKVPGKPQEVGNARNVECLWKATGSEQSQSNRRAMILPAVMQG